MYNCLPNLLIKLSLFICGGVMMYCVLKVGHSHLDHAYESAVINASVGILFE